MKGKKHYFIFYFALFHGPPAGPQFGNGHIRPGLHQSFISNQLQNPSLEVSIIPEELDYLVQMCLIGVLEQNSSVIYQEMYTWSVGRVKYNIFYNIQNRIYKENNRWYIFLRKRRIYERNSGIKSETQKVKHCTSSPVILNITLSKFEIKV